MTENAIQVKSLAKRYKLASARQQYKTARESIMAAVTSPFRKSTGTGGAPDNSFWALKDVNFEVKPGEVVGIIGRNGAGKSTLLKILSRITDPTEGEIDIVGRVGSLLEVGTGFHPELTGRENIYLNGAILGMQRWEITRKFDAIVAFAETEAFLDTPVKYYSSGMYMRLAFAVAAHLEPEILVVDEVLAVGDAMFQQKCLNRMGEVSREGRTVLFVSHNLSAIRDICSRAVWLDRGQVKQVGPASEIVVAYLALATDNMDRLLASNDKCALHAVDVKGEGSDEAVVDFRAPWSIRIQYEFFQPLPAGASIRITTSDGMVIMDTHEFVGGAETRAAGKYVATFDMTGIRLAPGTYLVNVYLMAHQMGVYLTAEPASRFTVHGSLKGFGGAVAPFNMGGFLAYQPPINTEAL